MNGLDLYPEMFNAAALASYYCSTDEGWDNFITWAKREEILEEGETMPRDVMTAASAGIRLIVRQVEIELIKARIEDVLGNI